jgi:murein DD-endopeptidase MepM/ murein hydrolase activator NlpD
MPLGTEIRAARAGLVVELREHWPDDDRTGGHENMVSLRHEDETISLYLHMKQDGIVVEMGDRVPRGGLLGYSGSSGDTQGIPHLHFQVCLRSGMCSWKTGEHTVPVNFRNAEGELDSRRGLAAGESYSAGSCP